MGKKKRRKTKKNNTLVKLGIGIILLIIAVVCMILTENYKSIQISAKTPDETDQEIYDQENTDTIVVPIEDIEPEMSIDENLIVEVETEELQKEENTTNKRTTNNASISSVPYYIKVNTRANVVTIYSKDSEGNYTVPVKAMICSTGTYTPPVAKYPKSQYKTTGGKNRWNFLQGSVYGQYATQIVGNILFHSVPYTAKSPSSLEYWEYDKLGTSASAGCIRLTVEDARWIYNNISRGTIVEFYSDSNPGPLGKPSAKKISSNVECRDWDPTDADPENPWRIVKEELVKEDKTEKQNTSVKANVINDINTNILVDDKNKDKTSTEMENTKKSNNEKSNTEKKDKGVENTDKTNTEKGNTQQENNKKTNMENDNTNKVTNKIEKVEKNDKKENTQKLNMIGSNT